MHWAARVAGGAAPLPEGGFFKSISCNIFRVQGPERQRATAQHCYAGVRLQVACPVVSCVLSTSVLAKAANAGMTRIAHCMALCMQAVGTQGDIQVQSCTDNSVTLHWHVFELA